MTNAEIEHELKNNLVIKQLFNGHLSLDKCA